MTSKMINEHPRFSEVQALLANSDFIIKPELTILDMTEDGQGTTEDLDASMKLTIPVPNNNHLEFHLEIDANFTLAHNPGPATDYVPTHLVVVMYYLSLVDIDSKQQFVILSNTTFEYDTEAWPTADQILEDVKDDIRDKYPACPY